MTSAAVTSGAVTSRAAAGAAENGVIENRSVVIVGAGPAGLTLAGLLGQYGVDVLVLERWPEAYPEPRAVHLDDEVCRVLADVGVAEEFAAISRPGLGLRLVSKDLTCLTEFRRDPRGRRHGYPEANMFDQPELEALLRHRVDAVEAVEVRAHCDVADVRQVDDHAVVTYGDSATHVRRFVRADYVIGADGANSSVRRAIGSRMVDLGFEQRWLVVDIATDVQLNHWEGVHQVCDARRAGTFMQIGPTRYRWEFRLLDGETVADFATLDQVRRLIRPWLGATPTSSLELVRAAEYTFRAQVADRWRDRRVLLCGDAAHLTPPFIGQGLGAGLRDANNLAWKLVGVLSGALPADALESYQDERGPHATAMIRRAVLMGRAMTGGGAVSHLARRSVLPIVTALPTDALSDSATPALSRSAFVETARWSCMGIGRGLAGQLVPNVELDDGRRVDDVAPGSFLVISSTLLTAGQRHEVSRRGATVLEVPHGSRLGGWLADGGARAAIVRPDHAVLAAGSSVASLITRVPAVAPQPVPSETEGESCRPSS